MAEVCSVFEQAGVRNISSVLASGNIIFNSERNEEELKSILETAMSEHFSYDAFLFVKSECEIKTTFDDNPFEAEATFHIYIFVGVDGIEKTLLSEFEKSRKAPGEEAQIVSSNFFWKVPKGNTLESEFGKILGRKNLKDSFTSRNINTFEKVLRKMKLR